MSDRGVRVLAGGVVLLAFTLAVAGGVLQYLTRDVDVEYYGLRGFQGLLGLVIALIGWLIATRVRRNPIGWIFLGAGIISAFQSFDSAYGTWSIARHGGSLPLTTLFVWLAVWIWVPFVGVLSTHALLLFPQGRLETPKQRALAVFATVAVGAFAVGVSFTPGQSGEMPVGVSNPYALGKTASDVLVAAGSLLYLAAVALSIGVLVGRFRRATGELRQQMKWITFAGVIAGVTIAASTLFLSLSADQSAPIVRGLAIGVIIGFAGIPVAAGIAVLRYGLYEIDVVINKTIVYGLIAVFITMVYLAVVVGIGALVGSGASTGLSIAATALVAVAVQPVRLRATKLANRLVFGKRASPYEALSEFSARLSEQTEEVLPRLARLMTEATAADRSSVWLAVGAGLQPAGAWPAGAWTEPVAFDDGDVRVPAADRTYAVRHEGELLGALAVATPPNEPLSASEERLLSDLASQAALVLRNARLIAELRASRQRLVAAQDLERRRIERNLHDGAQQQLVALAVNLKLVDVLIDQDPPRAREMLDRLRRDATDALDNLRDLARGIYPPALAERGLVAALESQAAKSPLRVTVDGAGVGRYPQEIEAAIYFCVLEALQNAAKYADAARASVRIVAADGSLRFEVEDDGRGFDVRTVRRGAGLTNMADRLDALGGGIEVRSSPGEGTVVAGRLPVTPAA